MSQTERVTVQLIVAAGGALQTLDQFDTKMTDAANASVKAGAGVDAFNVQLARQRAAMEAGLPVLKARAQMYSAEERALASLYGKADPLEKARIQAERDLSKAVAASSNLVVQGKLAEGDAIRQLTAIERAHVANINRVIEAERRSADAAQASAASVQGSAAAIRSYNTAANDNAAHSANIAMQFQDIAVSAQMGMSPMMIALQQGTQLSAIMNGMRSPLAALPAAFMAIVNPVSLLTIGLVGLGAVGAQWFFSLFQGAEDAEDALQAHLDILDKILVGYDQAKEAATNFVEASQQRSEGAVTSDLEAQRRAALKEIDSTLAAIATKQAEITTDFQQLSLSPMIHQETMRAAQGLDALQFSASMTREEVGRLETKLTQLANSDAPEQAKGYARDLLDLLSVVQRLTGEVGSFTTALNNVPRDIQIRLSMSREYGSAMGAMSDLYVDPRSRFDIMREELENQVTQATATAQTCAEAPGVGAKLCKIINNLTAASAAKEAA